MDASFPIGDLGEFFLRCGFTSLSHSRLRLCLFYLGNSDGYLGITSCDIRFASTDPLLTIVQLLSESIVLGFVRRSVVSRLRQGMADTCCEVFLDFEGRSQVDQRLFTLSKLSFEEQDCVFGILTLAIELLQIGFSLLDLLFAHRNAAFECFDPIEQPLLFLGPFRMPFAGSRQFAGRLDVLALQLYDPVLDRLQLFLGRRELFGNLAVFTFRSFRLQLQSIALGRGGGDLLTNPFDPLLDISNV